MTAVLMKDPAGRSRDQQLPAVLYDGIYCLEMQIRKILDTKL